MWRVPTPLSAAMKQDGSVVTWGGEDHGGNSDAVKEQLSDGVERVTGNGFAFAAVKQDGTIVTWGHAEYGGDSTKAKFLK